MAELDAPIVETREPWLARLEECQQEVANMEPNPYYLQAYRQAELGYWRQIPGWIHADVNAYKPTSCLDIGCAYGTLMLYVHRLCGCELYGTDFTPRYLSPALIGKYQIHFAVNNIELDSFPWQRQFDVILLTEVLEHFCFYAVPTLEKIGDLLAPGGKLYVSTPDAAHWGRKTTYYSSYRQMPLPSPAMSGQVVDDHVWQYSQEELVEVVQAAHLHIVRFDYAPGTGYRHFNLTLQRE